MPIRLISTDFDGTLFAEFENPPIPPSLLHLLAEQQRQGVTWVINTGRDLGSLLETLARAEPRVHPDALILVEREIYVRQDARYVPVQPWNDACTEDHRVLFRRVAPGLPPLLARLGAAHPATFYEDAFSPLCVLAETTRAADAVQAELDAYAATVPDLTVVRNDVYIRFAHGGYNKGTALTELGRRLGIGPGETVAAGDHYNDLPMLDPVRARWLVAPANAIAPVQRQVREAGGHISARLNGGGVEEGLRRWLNGGGQNR
ncbi:MAG: HAD family phosphatase [Verrucomicrobiae bacterium]|nr:HAD family phosphatase [Verrucomicrobiae bacterium]